MAATDNGTIIMKNSELMNTNDTSFDSEAEIVNGVYFHRNLVMEKAVHDQMEYHHNYDVGDNQFYLNLWKHLQNANKKVFYWTFNGTRYKTKPFVDGSYITTFSVWNGKRFDHYQIVQGYGISIYSCYSKHMKHALEKFMKYQRKVYAISHTFY